MTSKHSKMVASCSPQCFSYNYNSEKKTCSLERGRANQGSGGFSFHTVSKTLRVYQKVSSYITAIWVEYKHSSELKVHKFLFLGGMQGIKRQKHLKISEFCRLGGFFGCSYQGTVWSKLIRLRIWPCILLGKSLHRTAMLGADFSVLVSCAWKKFNLISR